MQLDFEFQDKRRLLLDYDDLKKMGIKFSREQFRRMEMDGRFPKRIRLSASRVAWKLSDIEAWVASRPVGLR
ncbi:helix-turn-helix transcriptional regulator [Ruegeria lacuscaerulensis]|uniref:helix-turn-helix transcriptional regulator n=1 Tax=Ruegeria lacuscaerulensis TaxID=55218 RepID=UPI00147D23C8|nr:AlpA family phage regulatory protein [Ruegeria lacuscaerulensis]